MIVYDSFFGNTEKVAQAIKDTFNLKKRIEITKVNEVKLEQLCGLNLLIVVSPTRGFPTTKELKIFLKKSLKIV